MLKHLGWFLLCCTVLIACVATPKTGSTSSGEIDRKTFNRMAAELFVPLFWMNDDDGVVAPSEIAVVFGMGDTTRRDWVQGDAFTPRFHRVWAQIVEQQTASPPTDPRLRAIQKELAQGHPTLIRTDLSDASEADRTIVRHILAAAQLVERLHARQNGVLDLADQIPDDDTMSKTVFYRNQGPWCEAPATLNDKTCNALADPPPKRSGLYDLSLQADDPKFCDTLGARQDGDALMHHFHTVAMNDGGTLVAVPYHQAFESQSVAIAGELDAAAAVITGPEEAAFKRYLEAAAKAFRDDSWPAADEAWAAMNADNSKWYLRIGPDETYFEPCSRKAGYHVSFARIDQSSRVWQARLDPLKADMEKAIADLAGPPYAARTVDFHLPDFIQIVLNAGDARRGLGATIGQSLPNWGPVANEGRGRTVAMTNVNTDPDSVDAVERQAASVLCPETMKSFVKDPESLTMSTVLHEAAHNLGPAHEYRVDGKTDDEIFGGPLASTLEELKAETASYYYADWLAGRGVISERDARVAHIRDLVWGFAHISRGLYDNNGRPKAYSHLSAIHLGYFVDAGVATWNGQSLAANGKDMGCLSVDLGKLPATVEKLMTTVARIKGAGDKDTATGLVEKYVDGAAQKPLLETITQRWLREPEASILYAIEL